MSTNTNDNFIRYIIRLSNKNYQIQGRRLTLDLN